MRPPLPDERLVEQVRRGDHDAKETLFARYHETLLAFCRHMLGGRDAAEDAVHSAFAQAIAALRRHDRPVHFKTLLYSVARQRCVVVLDTRPRGATPKIDLAGLDPEVARDEELRRLLAGLERLPVEQRALLVLSGLEGAHSRDELAALAGCPGDKAGELLAQARLALVEVEGGDDWTCAQVRGLLAAADGGELRRESLRRHVSGCESCSAVRAALAHQRRCLGLVLPVTPAPGLRAC